jgi:hypothetical protein
MNPHSNVSKLFAQPLGEQDHTVIFHIPLPQLMINDIFVDDHNHYWSISEELSRMTPDKNPLTNLPFEPEEWSRILKAREWGSKVDQPVPKPIQMTTTTTVQIQQIPSVTTAYEPITNYSWNGCSWLCCQNPLHLICCEESYDVECRFLCMYMRRNSIPYSGSCAWCIPCCSCHQLGEEDACYPFCCTLCISEKSCLFRRHTTKGVICPFGWNCASSLIDYDYSSFCFIINFYRNNSSNCSFITTPFYCYCSRNGKECCLTPLCMEIGDCFMTPLVCNKGSLFCFLGIPFMKLNPRNMSGPCFCECC